MDLLTTMVFLKLLEKFINKPFNKVEIVRVCEVVRIKQPT